MGSRFLVVGFFLALDRCSIDTRDDLDIGSYVRHFLDFTSTDFLIHFSIFGLRTSYIRIDLITSHSKASSSFFPAPTSSSLWALDVNFLPQPGPLYPLIVTINVTHRY